MEGCFLNIKHGPNPNVLQTGTAAQGQCQFAAGEPRHIFLRRLRSSAAAAAAHISFTNTCHGCSELAQAVIFQHLDVSLEM